MLKTDLLVIAAASLMLATGPRAHAQGEAGAAPASTEAAAGAEPTKTCFPACRNRYVCHPGTLECVSICNPPCANHEVCTEDAECVPTDERRETEPREPGDRRFRIALLMRVGLGGNSVLKRNPPLSSLPDELKTTPAATLGFDLRFEKPVAKYVTVGGLVSNHWFRARTFGQEGGDLQPEDRNDYALDIAPFVKPRYPFKAGKHEAEAYVIINIGGSIRVMEIFDVSLLRTKTSVFGGFNWGVAPGFQIFLAEHMGLVFEVGYARSWFKIESAFLKNIKVGQATLRFGFTFPF